MRGGPKSGPHLSNCGAARSIPAARTWGVRQDRVNLPQGSMRGVVRNIGLRGTGTRVPVAGADPASPAVAVLTKKPLSMQQSKEGKWLVANE